MLVIFRPAHPGAVVFSGGVCLWARPEPYNLPESEVTRLCATTAGIDGAPCLIICDHPAPAATVPGTEAAREFIAAISAPTALNPETPHAAAPAPVAEPVKRKPGRKPRD